MAKKGKKTDEVKVESASRVSIVADMDTLSRELDLHARIIDKRNTILGYARMQARDGRLTVETTDLDRALSTTVTGARVHGEGVLIVSLMKLQKIMKSLDKGELKIEDESESWARVSQGRFSARVEKNQPENYPTIQRPKNLPYRIDRAELGRLIADTKTAITSEESRYALNGAMLESVDGSGADAGAIRMAATDGYRLALADTREGTLGEGFRVIIPKDALSFLEVFVKNGNGNGKKHNGGAFIPEGEGDWIAIGSDESHVVFRRGDKVFSSRILTGQFPDYERVLPKYNERRVSFDSEAARRALKRVLPFVDERSKGIKIFVDREMYLGADSVDSGSAQDSFPCDWTSTVSPVYFGISGAYLGDFLSRIEGRAEAEIKDAQSPVLFVRPDRSLLYVIMPMRLEVTFDRMMEMVGGVDRFARIMLEQYGSLEAIADGYIEHKHTTRDFMSAGGWEIDSMMLKAALEHLDALELVERRAELKANPVEQQELI